MNILLFSLPGTPVLYYGDELGMGDNYYLGDRDGVRTPMQWSPDRNAGFSRSNPHQLYLPLIIDPEYHYDTVNVENQERNLSSLLWWMKQMIAMRKNYKAFSRGSIELLFPENYRVLCFIRQYKDEIILIIINLSRFAQSVELHLSRYNGYTPREVFSFNKFPRIKKSPYSVMLGSYGYFWFLLEKEKKIIEKGEKAILPGLKIIKKEDELLEQENREALELTILPRYLSSTRWFGGKGRIIGKIKIIENMPVHDADIWLRFIILEVVYNDGTQEMYMVPLGVLWGNEVESFRKNYPDAVIAGIEMENKRGIIIDGIFSTELHHVLLDLMSKRKKIKGENGELHGAFGEFFRILLRKQGLPRESKILKTEQSNTSILFENKLILKFFRKLESGMNPDPEIVRFLTEKTKFSHIAAYAGVIEYTLPKENFFIGFMQHFVFNQGDAWRYALDNVMRYYDNVLVKKKEFSKEEAPVSDEMMKELCGEFFIEMIGLLGKRTAELHLALASETGEEAFAPEAFSLLYQRSVYQSMKSMVRHVFRLLHRNTGTLTGSNRKDAETVLSGENKILNIWANILGKKISAKKIRIHGDYHLGQVLFTGKDFTIIDFEGEPARALSERRLKRSPFRDVAGMVRSFHYAAYTGYFRIISRRTEDTYFFEPWVERWYRFVKSIFLAAYLETAGQTSFIPSNKNDTEMLLEIFILEKAVYELGYELNNRPGWIHIPLKGILHILKSADVKPIT
jgi:maltose alpha-D-glucosyltransferase/alpha-amylase